MLIDKYGRQTTIVVDLDGTLVEEAPFPGRIGDWLPGAREALRKMLDAGYRVEVHTCRLHSMEPNFSCKRNQGDWFADFAQLRKKLNDAGLQQVAICMDDKPPAKHYIDDRAIKFDGNWRKVLKRVLR